LIVIPADNFLIPLTNQILKIGSLEKVTKAKAKGAATGNQQ
jgi:hypothetical protein